jgi:hypothetical protein
LYIQARFAEAVSFRAASAVPVELHSLDAAIGDSIAANAPELRSSPANIGNGRHHLGGRAVLLQDGVWP